MEDAFEKGMARVCGIEDSDRRECHRLGRVDVNKFMLALLCLLELAMDAFVDLFFSFSECLLIYGSAKLREDLG